MILWKKGKVQIKTKFNGVIRPLAWSDLCRKSKQTNKAVKEYANGGSFQLPLTHTVRAIR